MSSTTTATSSATWQSLALELGPVTFAGCVCLERCEQGVRPWRLFRQVLPLYEPGMIARAASPAGVRLTFRSNTRRLGVQVRRLPESETHDPKRPMVFDLLVDGKMHARESREAADHRVEFADLPAGEHLIELYLPQRHIVAVSALEVDAGAAVWPHVDRRPRWVVYGSSITHCGEAAGPSETWPAIVANRFGLHLTNLGYGGNCHMEPMVARMIRDLPADYISLCVGINIMGQGSYNERTFRAGVIGLIQTIRDKHPRTPIAAVSPICSPPRETTPNRAGYTLSDTRLWVAQAVAALQEQGDDRVFAVSGLDVFGADLAQYLPDQLHPNAEGYRLLARNYSVAVMSKAFGLTPIGRDAAR
jgi:hypothetical protein